MPSINDLQKQKKIPNEQAKTIPCHYPWTSMYISPNGDVKHCCNTNLTKLGNLKTQTVDEIWNGKLYKQVRKKIYEGDFDGAFCNPNCEGLRTGRGYPWPKIKPGSGIIIENEEKGKEHFKNGTEKVHHFPLYLSLEFSDNCNLRCKMCYYEFKPPYTFIPSNAVAKLLKISKYARTLALMGGEVFMNKMDLHFIDNYEQTEGSNIGFITNGSYLSDAMIKRIEKFRKMWMQISIDATEKNIYETIRRKGNWDSVNENVQRVVKRANELKNDGYEWSISLAYVVMKTNFSNLPDALKYAINLNINIGFHIVKGFHLFDENIFVYKGLIKEEDTRKFLNQTYKLLEQNKDNYNHYKKVLFRIKDIDKSLDNKKIRVPYLFVRFLRFIIPGKRIGYGLNPKDRRIGHFIEIYYNWKVGNASFKNTISYLAFKGFRKFKDVLKK